VVGGRLVFWLPTTYDFTDDDLPRHPCLAVIANSEQRMTQKIGRRLVTMAKTATYDPAQKACYDDVAAAAASRPFAQLAKKIQGAHLAGSLDRREAKRLKAESISGAAL
jgi:tRNA (guanine10-N2)-methyltransferase